MLLVALEVNQAIQDWSNSVPLVQNKETVLRAFLQLPQLDQPASTAAKRETLRDGWWWNAGRLASNSAELQWSGIWCKTHQRGRRSEQFREEQPQLPPSKGMVVGHDQSPAGLHRDNVTVIPTNVVPANSTVQVTFCTQAAPQVKFYGINWTNRTGASQSISGATMQNMVDRMKSNLPRGAGGLCTVFNPRAVVSIFPYGVLI